MPLEKSVILDQIKEVLEKYKEYKSSIASRNSLTDFSERITMINSLLLDAIYRLSPSGSSYYKNAKLIMIRKNVVSFDSTAKYLAGILNGLKTAYESGYLETVHERIHADLFADFLEMAEYLQKDGFKDAAAVIAGSTLEEHLRKLCIKHGIDPIDDGDKHKKADRLNAELTKAEAYNKLEQKNVTAWLELRNNAAHGHYDEYDHKHVADMIQGIRNFMVRYPA